ncbi:hypothetical protein BST61_g5408 [Cercospora zeina]
MAVLSTQNTVNARRRHVTCAQSTAAVDLQRCSKSVHGEEGSLPRGRAVVLQIAAAAVAARGGRQAPGAVTLSHSSRESGALSDILRDTRHCCVGASFVNGISSAVTAQQAARGGIDGMGALCSCLGQRPPSQDDGDLDRILNSEQPTYGTHDGVGVIPRDEEELRRERDALEYITARAADHMIDITNPSQTDREQPRMDGVKHHISHVRVPDHPPKYEGDSDEEEDAWLRDLGENDVDIAIPQRGNLVMDISLLRDTSQQVSSKTEAASRGRFVAWHSQFGTRSSAMMWHGFEVLPGTYRRIHLLERSWHRDTLSFNAARLLLRAMSFAAVFPL